MELLPVVFWTADLRLRITSPWGSGFRGLRAFRGNVPGQTVHEYLRCPRVQETPVKQHLEALNGVSSRFLYRRRKRVFDINIEPMRNASGVVIGCIGLALDITERKSTEEEIRSQATLDGLTGLLITAKLSSIWKTRRSATAAPATPSACFFWISTT